MTQAWIVDEIGKKRAGEAFLRGSQAGQAGGLIAIPLQRGIDKDSALTVVFSVVYHPHSMLPMLR